MSWTIDELVANSPCAREDTRRIIAHFAGCDYATVVAFGERTVDSATAKKIQDACQRRRHGVALSYLTGTKEFYGRSFRVTSDTLVPRAETEHLVDAALSLCCRHTRSVIVDVGTGSGNIIVSIAAECAARGNHSHGFLATDTSVGALHCADGNARMHGVAEQIAFLHADGVTPLYRARTLRTFLHHHAPHLIICANLPYVNATHRFQLLQREESRALRFEPPSALFAAHGGLAAYEKLFAQLSRVRRALPYSGVDVLCEIDPSQDRALRRLARRTGLRYHTTIHDLSHAPRVVHVYGPPLL